MSYPHVSERDRKLQQMKDQVILREMHPNTERLLNENVIFVHQEGGRFALPNRREIKNMARAYEVNVGPVVAGVCLTVLFARFINMVL